MTYDKLNIYTDDENIYSIITKTYNDHILDIKLHFINATKYNHISIETTTKNREFIFKTRKTMLCKYIIFYGYDYMDKLCGWCIICNINQPDIKVHHYWYFLDERLMRTSSTRRSETIIKHYDYDTVGELKSEDKLVHNILTME
jgi:hypothetical protein